MNSGKQIAVAWYAVIDFITASLAWGFFFFIRRWLLNQPTIENGQLQTDDRFWLGIALIPVGWLILYTLVGAYRHFYKKSRLFEFTSTFVCSLIGCFVLFFALLLDDVEMITRIIISPFFACSAFILFLLFPEDGYCLIK